LFIVFIADDESQNRGKKPKSACQQHQMQQYFGDGEFNFCISHKKIIEEVN
jgi:hypothetical protein